jgi:hypothetical protein
MSASWRLANSKGSPYISDCVRVQRPFEASIASSWKLPQTSGTGKQIAFRFLRDSAAPDQLSELIRMRRILHNAERRAISGLIRRLEEQYRDIDEVSDFVRGAPIEQVADKTVSMRGHCDQVDRMFTCEFDDFVRWLSHC